MHVSSTLIRLDRISPDKSTVLPILFLCQGICTYKRILPTRMILKNLNMIGQTI